MAKSIRSKKEKRLRAIRREMVEPYYDKKDEAKYAAQAACLAAPKLPVRSSTSSMEVAENNASASDPNSTTTTTTMDVEMNDGTNASLKPVSVMGKNKLRKKFKQSRKKRNYKGKGKISKRKI